MLTFFKGVSIPCLLYEIVLLVIQIILRENGEFEWTFSLDWLRLSHVCFKWRAIVLDNGEFGGHLQVHVTVIMTSVLAASESAGTPNDLYFS
jgi:hypothetical protein